VAEDANGKQQTRAYSLASAAQRQPLRAVREPRPGRLLFQPPCRPARPAHRRNDPDPWAARPLVPARAHHRLHPGRHRYRRGAHARFSHWLFPEDGPDGPDRSNGKQIWLVYGTRHESGLYYRAEFEALARRKPNFHYLPTLSRAPKSWNGLRGQVQEHVARIVEERAARLGQPLPAPPPDPSIPPSELNFDIYAYICGLNDMVSAVRERLAGFGWHRKQIVFERYD
jgi:hypothetical protein